MFYDLLTLALRPTRWLALALLLPLASRAQTQTPATITPVSLTAIGTAATQNFNTLISTASGTSSAVPAGWGFVETPTDNLYSVTIASGTDPGGAYSLGSTNASDRAFGTFFGTASPGVVASVGGAFTNNTGQTITGFTISYTGEQWRLGSSSRSSTDRLDFQYSTTATSLATGAYTDVNILDFSTPVILETGAAKNGNVAPYRTALTATIPVTLAVGATIYVRWTDADAASGTDDALGVDDFSLTPIVPPTVTTAVPALSGATATLGGNVTSAGSSAVTDRGVVYSTSNTNPTVGGTGVTQLAIGTGTGAFSGSATVSLFYTTYYVAAYATTADGTSYGAVQTFTTGPGTIALTAIGTAYTQDFNALPVATSTATLFAKSTLPPGWDFMETGTGADNTYASGSSGTGNTYSLGGTSSNPSVNPTTERALGTNNNIVMPTIGAAFVNNTGQTINALAISYTGEQWRLGNTTRPTPDRLDFQYSTTATSLGATTGYLDYNLLDFVSPVVNNGTAAGFLDGNLAANRTAIGPVTITGLSIAPGATFYLRWVDFDVSGGADDALGVEDFSISAVTPPTVTTAAPNVSGSIATVGGTVTSAGTSAVTGRGVVYSTNNTDPTIGGTNVTQLPIGSGTGAFSTSLNGLLSYTTYYVNAYATSATGTAYGTTATFSTGPGTISVAALNTAYTENFNTSLLATGTANPKSTLPTGWDFVETDVAGGTGGSDNTYSTSTPSTGNTYSLGTAGATDRAFGGVQNANILPTIGAAYVNNSGATISGLLISYIGEQWRVGNGSRTSVDRLQFEYSTNATDLVTGTYTPVTVLDFAGPVTGVSSGSTTGIALDGNDAANRRLLMATVPVSIAPGATFYLRWTDYNAPGGGDDALGVDDFSLTALAAPGDLTVSTTGQTISGFYNNVTITGTGAATVGGSLAVAGTLTVQTGGSLATNCQTINGPGSFILDTNATLSICDPGGIAADGLSGAVQLVGTLSFSDNANYIYNGTAAQITGSGLPSRTRNLTVNNPAGLTLTASTSVIQALTMASAGNLSLGGRNLTLRSDASGTALVVNSGAGVVIGNATVQRYISGSNTGLGYRHYSAPISNATVNSLSTAGFVPEVSQGAAYNASATPGTVTPFPNVFGYDQSRVATATSNLSAFDKGWAAPTSTTDPLTVGRGYTVNIAGTERVAFVGNLNNDDVLVNLTRNSGATAADAGWHLVGNPYPAPLDWSQVAAADRSNLDASMYVFESSSQYGGMYRAFVNNVGDPLIASSQGFFVRVSAGQTSGALTFRNSQRRTSYADQATFRRGSTDTRPQVQLTLSGNGLTDQVFVYAEAGASAGVNAAFDAVKLPNPSGLNLSALATGGEALAIQGLSQFTAATVVPLTLAVPAAGTYTLQAAALGNLPAGLHAFLVDVVTGLQHNLSQQPSYTFVVAAAPLVAGRFVLRFGPAANPLATAGALTAAQVTVYPNPAHGRFTVVVPSLAGLVVEQATLLNSLGQVVRQPAARPAGAGTTFEIDAAGLASGIYTLRLQAGATTISKRVVIN